MPQPEQTEFTVAQCFDGPKLKEGDERTPGLVPPATGRRYPLAFGPLLFWQSVNAALTPELAKGRVSRCPKNKVMRTISAYITHEEAASSYSGRRFGLKKKLSATKTFTRKHSSSSLIFTQLTFYSSEHSDRA